MKLPTDPSLPFFAYGVFRPGELAFLQIKVFVSAVTNASTSGRLRIRDGLPLASFSGEGAIDGTLVRFTPNRASEAYERIAALEPDKQYVWKCIEIERERVNTLAGKSPEKGAVDLDAAWTSVSDPLFTSALEVIEETLQQNRTADWDLKPLFRLEMAYLLLWTSIERYASLRYDLSDKATQKVMRISSEAAFGLALQQCVAEQRSIQRADDPTKQCTLDPNDPKQALGYYYQLRSNLVHRGKSLLLDHNRIRDSLNELLMVFRETLRAAFEESKWP